MSAGTLTKQWKSDQVLDVRQESQLPLSASRLGVAFPFGISFGTNAHLLLSERVGFFSLVRPGPVMAVWVSVFLSGMQPGLR